MTSDVLGSASVTHDVSGNVVDDGSSTYSYSDRGRMAGASTPGGSVTYAYNGLGLRARKSGAAVSTGAAYYVYDEAGQLLGEYDANGTPVYETIYLNTTPVGAIKQTGSAGSSSIAVTLYNVYADHLDTPRLITRQDQTIVWRWDTAEAFGGAEPDQNPSGVGTFTFNPRFPGQVFDSETGLNQNWNREYNPRWGRYSQSDPIGLECGINTFSYVANRPLSNMDPLGLWLVTFGGYAGAGGQVSFGSDNGNPFLTLRAGFGAGGGISFSPAGGMPGEQPNDRSKGGMAVSCTGKASFNAGILQSGLEFGAARNYNNDRSSWVTSPSESGRFSNGWLGKGAATGLNANGSIGAQVTFYGSKR